MEMKEAEPGKIIAACSHSSWVSDGVGHEIGGRREVSEEDGRHDPAGPRMPAWIPEDNR